MEVVCIEMCMQRGREMKTFRAFLTENIDKPFLHIEETPPKHDLLDHALSTKMPDVEHKHVKITVGIKRPKEYEGWSPVSHPDMSYLPTVSQKAHNSAIATINKTATAQGHEPFKIQNVSRFIKGAQTHTVIQLHNGTDDAVYTHYTSGANSPRSVHTKYGSANWGGKEGLDAAFPKIGEQKSLKIDNEIEHYESLDTTSRRALINTTTNMDTLNHAFKHEKNNYVRSTLMRRGIPEHLDHFLKSSDKSMRESALEVASASLTPKHRDQAIDYARNLDGNQFRGYGVRNGLARSTNIHEYPAIKDIPDLQTHIPSQAIHRDVIEQSYKDQGGVHGIMASYHPMTDKIVLDFAHSGSQKIKDDILHYNWHGDPNSPIHPIGRVTEYGGNPQQSRYAKVMKHARQPVLSDEDLKKPRYI